MANAVKIKPIQEIPNQEGCIQHMLRCDEAEFFSGFGEIYFSFINPGVIKGWHRHSEQTSAVSCVRGHIQLMVYDGRRLQEIRIGPGDRKLVVIPPGVLYGWKNLGNEPAILANCASHPYDPAKSEKLPLNAVPCTWAS